MFLFESFAQTKWLKTNKKITQKGKTVVNCVFLLAKAQILRNLWKFLATCCTVSPFRISDRRYCAGNTVLYGRYCTVLEVLNFARGTLLNWRYSTVLEVLYCTGGTLLYWRHSTVLEALYCTIREVLYYTGGTVLYWRYCTIQRILYSTGGTVHMRYCTLQEVLYCTWGTVSVFWQKEGYLMKYSQSTTKYIPTGVTIGWFHVKIGRKKSTSKSSNFMKKYERI